MCGGSGRSKGTIQSTTSDLDSLTQPTTLDGVRAGVVLLLHLQLTTFILVAKLFKQNSGVFNPLLYITQQCNVLEDINVPNCSCGQQYWCWGGRRRSTDEERAPPLKCNDLLHRDAYQRPTEAEPTLQHLPSYCTALFFVLLFVECAVAVNDTH